MIEKNSNERQPQASNASSGRPASVQSQVTSSVSFSKKEKNKKEWQKIDEKMNRMKNGYLSET